MNYPHSKKSRINKDLGRLIEIRTKNRAFHQNGDQKILMISPSVFSVLRTSPEMDQHILTMTNVTSKECHLEISLPEIDSSESQWFNLISENVLLAENKKLRIKLEPYDVIWLQPSAELE